MYIDEYFVEPVSDSETLVVGTRLNNIIDYKQEEPASYHMRTGGEVKRKIVSTACSSGIKRFAIFFILLNVHLVMIFGK